MAAKPAWAIGARQGPLRRHKQLVFFACEGLIALHDERDTAQEEGDVYEVITPDDFEFRAKALGRFGKKVKASDKPWQRQEGAEMRQAARDMLATVVEAKEMGDPSDPRVQAFWARHRRSSTISMSGSTNNFEHGSPEKSLDEMNRDAPNTGRTAQHTLDGGDLDQMRQTAQKIYKPPRKKNRTGRLVLDL